MNESVSSTVRINERSTIIRYMVDGVEKNQRLHDDYSDLFEALETTPDSYDGGMIRAWIDMHREVSPDLAAAQFDVKETLEGDPTVLAETIEVFKETRDMIIKDSKLLKAELKKAKKDGSSSAERLGVILEVQPYFSKGIDLHIKMLEEGKFCSYKWQLGETYLQKIRDAEALLDALDLKEGF